MPIDYKKYPANWKTEIVPRILERASHKCEKCGLKNKQIVYAIKLWVRCDGKYKFKTLWFSSVNDATREDTYGNVKAVKVVLTVAHLDHDELNHNVSDERLSALCQLCHLRYDAKEKYRRKSDFYNKVNKQGSKDYSDFVKPATKSLRNL